MLATGQDPEFAKEAMAIRERCVEERERAEATSKADMTMSAMMNVALGRDRYGGPAREPQWKKLEIAIDSGAAETVIPHTLVTAHPIHATERSRAGVCYASATGQPIPNMGEQQLPMVTEEGSLRMMAFQAAPVAKALGSVAKICQAGHAVIFDSEGSYIVNKSTGEINWLREDNGNYILDVWIPPPEALQDQDFAWQP